MAYEEPCSGRSAGPGATLVLACLAVFVVIPDATIVAVALADIREQLGVPQERLAWVVNAYTLLIAGFLLLGGRCADVFGHRRTMLTGAAVFTAGSLAAGLASSSTTLLTARAVQGLGGVLACRLTCLGLVGGRGGGVLADVVAGGGLAVRGAGWASWPGS